MRYEPNFRQIGAGIAAYGAGIADYVLYRDWNTALHKPFQFIDDYVLGGDLERMAHSVPNVLGPLEGSFPDMVAPMATICIGEGLMAMVEKYTLPGTLGEKIHKVGRNTARALIPAAFVLGEYFLGTTTLMDFAAIGIGFLAGMYVSEKLR